MKLLICDDLHIIHNTLPTNVQGFYVVDYISLLDNFSELITLEAIDGVWNITSNKNIRISLKDNIYEKAPLVNYNVYDIFFNIFNKSVKVVAVPDNEPFRFANWVVFNKILIGQSSDCNIRCNILTLKDIHAVIECVDERYYVSAIDSKSNIYVNNRRVIKQELKFGDVIFIECIKIIWMKTYIAITNPNNSITFSMLNFSNVNIDEVNNYTETTESERNIKLYSDNDAFYHTPKIKSYIKEENITIDPPPESDKTEKTPLIISIGSSALIGITSCFTGISAIHQLQRGTIDTFNFFMELAICIIMLLSSFALPIFTELWQKKQIDKREKLRIKKYEEYLAKNSNEIAEIIKKQESILREKHLTLNEIANETKSKGYNLWSREIIDRDVRAKYGL